MEEAAELANYLPLSFKTPKEQDYIEFLWDAFETNTTHGGFNRSAQHTNHCSGRRSVANEVPNTNVLHRHPEGIDVGAMEGWLDSSSDREAV